MCSTDLVKLVSRALPVALALATCALDADAQGFTVRLSSGYSLPLGAASRAVPLSDSASGAIPFVLRFAAPIQARVELGAYAGFSLLVRDCGGGSSCSGRDARLGLEARFPFTRGFAAPWASLGAGAEILDLGASAAGLSSSSTRLGIEPLRASFGVGFSPWPHWRIGPILESALGIFATGFDNVEGLELDRAIAHRTIHAWLTLGIELGYER